MTYYVKKVRKESVRTKSGGTHEHIVGVVTGLNIYYSNKEVVGSIEAAKQWFTDVEGEPKATIRPMRFCPAPECLHQPYLTTDPDHSRRNNLENLPRG